MAHSNYVFGHAYSRYSGRGRLQLGRSAFSLIEMLVVIAIIAILIGILVPVIGSARQTARNATTNSLITTFNTAVNQFRADNNRLPGHFSQNDLGQTSNSVAITQMENALLELAGGIVPRQGAGSRDSFMITVGGRESVLSASLVGGSENPGYLPLPVTGIRENSLPAPSSIAPAEPGTMQYMGEGAESSGFAQLPDLLDAWGRPIMMWARNESPGSNPRPSFSGIESPTSPTGRRSTFYWNCNRGYLAASSQQSLSAIGGNIAPDLRIRSMAALLGHPSFPDPLSGGVSSVLVPAVPIGDFVIQSAGRDGIYAENKGQELLEFQYVSGGVSLTAANVGNVSRHRASVESIDDTIVGGN